MADQSMSADHAVDAIVAGAGVVGLAVARELAVAGHSVIIVERADIIGAGTSSRNSEVIHAGIYYPKGSLKAELCVEGKERMYAFCARSGVEHRRTGKLIVATEPHQSGELDRIETHARAAGVTDLERLTGDQSRSLEPEIAAAEALLSPSTGIVDSHGLMLALLGEAEANGALLATSTPVHAGQPTSDGGWVLALGGDDPCRIACRHFINAAGLGAQAIAHCLDGLAAEHVPPLHYAKGHYFSVSGRGAVERLIYPVPEPGMLGIHITIDLQGRMRLGPDLAEADGEDYSVPADRAAAFSEAVTRYFPGITKRTIAPDYAGIRPRITPPGEPLADFMIQGPESHGLPGLINLFGIESPGLTASLAIADRVRRRALAEG